MSAGSFHNEEAGDSAETFQLPKITGEEDEEMVESELFKPEVSTPTLEDNQTNEAGVEDFLASLSEYRTQAPHYSGDVVLEEDHEEELNMTPFKVIDEYYGGDSKGRGIWNHYFRTSSTCLQTFLQPQIGWQIQKVLLFSLACTLMPTVTSVKRSSSLK